MKPIIEPNERKMIDNTIPTEAKLLKLKSRINIIMIIPILNSFCTSVLINSGTSPVK